MEDLVLQIYFGNNFFCFKKDIADGEKRVTGCRFLRPNFAQLDQLNDLELLVLLRLNGFPLRFLGESSTEGSTEGFETDEITNHSKVASRAQAVVAETPDLASCTSGRG